MKHNGSLVLSYLGSKPGSTIYYELATSCLSFPTCIKGIMILPISYIFAEV